jgi:ABC-type sugar transport system substrate-binding protein
LIATAGCSTPVTTEAETNPTGDIKQITIGFNVPVLANPFWKQNVEFAKKAAEAVGAKLIVVDANQDEAKQLKLMEDLVAQGVDGIIVAPVTTAVVPALIKVTDKANIPLVFAERTPGFEPDASAYPSYLGFVGADSYAGAQATAQALYDAGKFNIVATTGTKGSSIAEDRIKGLLDFVKDHPPMKVLQVQYGVELEEDGQIAIENFLSAFPGPAFDGVWNYTDSAAVGAAAAIKRAGFSSDVAVTGFDGQPDGAQAIANGDMLATSGGQFIDGAFAFLMIYDFVNGHKPKTPYVVMPYLVIDASNVVDYQEQFGGGNPPYDLKSMSVTHNPEASTDDFKIEIQE